MVSDQCICIKTRIYLNKTSYDTQPICVFGLILLNVLGYAISILLSDLDPAY